MTRTPPGVDRSSEKLTGMFAEIVPRYDFLNRLLSAGRDESWRRRAVRLSRVSKGDSVLDVGCGTGELAFIFSEAAGENGFVTGADFTLPMLARAREKMGGRNGRERVEWVGVDAHELPFATGSFDCVGAAFSFRSFRDPGLACAEILRVLKPGGRFVVLEFTRPPSVWFRAPYYALLRTVVPVVGAALSRWGAYSYLSRTIKEWPEPAELNGILEEYGFTRVGFEYAGFFGVAAIHVGYKPEGD